MKRISVAIDGPAGAGKSSISRRVAQELGYVYIDTGAMYRAVAVYALENGIEPGSRDIVPELDKINISIKYVSGEMRVFLNDNDVSGRIRENDASMGASAVAAIPEVRERLVAIQRSMSAEGGIIMDGRDIGTVVLPQAELKIYLTASADERARRRYEEYLNNGVECDFEELKRDVIKRDENDMNRAVSPLRRAADAVEVDTTGNTFEQSVEIIKNMVKELE